MSREVGISDSSSDKVSTDRYTAIPSRRHVFAWYLYDFANSAYTTVILTAVYIVYFKKVVAAGYSPHETDLLWGGANSLSSFLVLLLAPYLGILADLRRTSFRYLIASSLLCIIGTSLLSLPQEGDMGVALGILIVTTAAYEIALSFYGALLRSLGSEATLGRLSGYGWALGYIGGLGCLLLCLPFAQEMPHLIPLVVAVWYLLFALPLFSSKDAFSVYASRKSSELTSQTMLEVLRLTLRRFRELRSHPVFLRFLLSYFFYNNAVLTVILFAAGFATDSLKFTTNQNIILIALMNVVAAPGALLFGRYADKYGCKHTLVVSLLIWLCVIGGAVLAALPGLWSLEQAQRIFWFVAAGAALAMGAVQSTSRTFVALYASSDRQNEYFGFFALVGKGSAIVGPLAFGLVSSLLQSQVAAVASIGVFFVIGLLLLLPLAPIIRCAR
jgi:MFS transporter, UMF1 family